jgi:hypothetical protein
MVFELSAAMAWQLWILMGYVQAGKGLAATEHLQLIPKADPGTTIQLWLQFQLMLEQ